MLMLLPNAAAAGTVTAALAAANAGGANADATPADITSHTPARPGGPAGPIGPAGPVAQHTHDNRNAQRQRSVSLSTLCCWHCHLTWLQTFLHVRCWAAWGSPANRLTSLPRRPRLAGRTYCVLTALGNAGWLQRHCKK
jgi:hypothetical protein